MKELTRIMQEKDTKKNLSFISSLANIDNIMEINERDIKEKNYLTSYVMPKLSTSDGHTGLTK